MGIFVEVVVKSKGEIRHFLTLGDNLYAGTRVGARVGNPKWPRFFDGSDDLQCAAALKKMLDVELEYPFSKTIAWFSPSGPVFAVQNPISAVLSAIEIN
ncbi:MAG: hypothetical protein ACU843_04380 [Gammaproteobacteria bacterium]